MLKKYTATNIYGRLSVGVIHFRNAFEAVYIVSQSEINFWYDNFNLARIKRGLFGLGTSRLIILFCASKSDPLIIQR